HRRLPRPPQPAGHSARGPRHRPDDDRRGGGPDRPEAAPRPDPRLSRIAARPRARRRRAHALPRPDRAGRCGRQGDPMSLDIVSLDIVQMVLVTVLTAATPLILAGIGELVVERSGVLNLGVE